MARSFVAALIAHNSNCARAFHRSAGRRQNQSFHSRSSDAWPSS
jgi:hypothetical protein